MDGFKEKACKGKEETAILYMIEGEIMRIRGSLEQAICIVLLISTSSRPVKSSELSKKLHVSDSYLKKSCGSWLKRTSFPRSPAKTAVLYCCEHLLT